MATAYIRFGRVLGGGAPVYTPIPDQTETITTSGTSQTTTIAAQEGRFATISAVGGVIRYAVGPNPAALAGDGDWVLDGGTKDIGPLTVGDKIAVINAA